MVVARPLKSALKSARFAEFKAADKRGGWAFGVKVGAACLF